MIKVFACLWLLLSSTSHAGTIARAVARFPDLPNPPQGEIQWIARSMRMNGLPMTIRSLASRSEPNEVVHFYESWAKQTGGLQTRRWRSRESEVLSIKAVSYLITIELQQVVKGTQGTVVTSSPVEKAVLSTRTDFPHPSSWRVANLQQYEDEEKETEHITFTSARGLSSEAQACLETLATNGWTLVNKHAASVNTVSVEAQRSAELASVLITSAADPRANTVVTVLWRKG